MDLSDIVIVPSTKKKRGAILMKISPKVPSLAPIVNELDLLFEKFNDKFFDSYLSKPVITLIEKGRRNAYGWCATEKVWQDDKEDRHYEINICPEHLDRPIEDICGTLLHEMVHLKNLQDDIQDCSRSSQYHNKKFKICAEKHGLNAQKTEKYGFADTSLKPEAHEFITSLNLKSFELFRNLNFSIEETEGDAEGEQEELPRKSSSRKYVCPTCDLTVRATKEVWVRCDECDELLVTS